MKMKVLDIVIPLVFLGLAASTVVVALTTFASTSIV